MQGAAAGYPGWRPVLNLLRALLSPRASHPQAVSAIAEHDARARKQLALRAHALKDGLRASQVRAAARLGWACAGDA